MDQNQNSPVNQPAAPVNTPVSPLMPPLNPKIEVAGNAATVSHKKVGPIMVILVVVLILIMAALYLFAARISQTIPTDSGVAEFNSAASQAAVHTATSVPQITNQDDDLQSIQSDLDESTKGLEVQNF